MSEFLDAGYGVTDEGAQVIVSMPPHLRSVKQSSPEGWAQSWSRVAVRSETKALARDYAANGFNAQGWPTHPRTLALICEDTGRAEKTVRRFHVKAEGLQMLTRVGRKVFQSGKRATPVYALTIPVAAAPAPASLDDEIGALVSYGERCEKWRDESWQNTSEMPPAWATGC